MIRVSGDRAIEIASRIFRGKTAERVLDYPSHTIHLGELRDPSSRERLDEVMLAVMRAPRSYTRADTVEIYCHGGALVLRRAVDLFISQGARPAEPGEFTKWAFLNGRIDLTQAEAVMELIRSKTDAAQRAAFAQLGGALRQRIGAMRAEAIMLLAEIEAGIDFSDEDLRFVSTDQTRKTLESLRHQTVDLLSTASSGVALREGVATAIVGRPNVGKSSLMNALLMQNRAIVTEIPGTTRDVIEEYLDLEGIPLRIMDTAGLRETTDRVEREGIIRTRQAIDRADLVLLVVEAGNPKTQEETSWIEGAKKKPMLLVHNKMDLLPPGTERLTELELDGPKNLFVSAVTGEGLKDLKAAILKLVRGGIVTSGEREAMINERHKSLLLNVKYNIEQSLDTLQEDTSPELIALDLRAAIDALGEVTGETTTEDLLDRIFLQFCIGK